MLELKKNMGHLNNVRDLNNVGRYNYIWVGTYILSLIMQVIGGGTN